jgi:hypothetical protein
MAMRNAKRYSVDEVVADLIANSVSEDDFMDDYLARPRSPDHSDTGGESGRIKPRRILFILDILAQKGLIWTFGHYPLPQLERICNYKQHLYTL